jgi:hypothetical protein
MLVPDSTDVLLVLSGSPWPAGEDGQRARRALADVMARSGCPQAHLLRIDEFQTPSFIWPLLIELRLPGRGGQQEQLERATALREDLYDQCGWLEHQARQSLWLSQARFGAEHDGAALIVSLYSWQPGTTPETRDRDMWDHFDMEREEPDYTAVHFNRSHGPEHFDNHAFDFAFQAYIDDPAGIPRIYASPRLAAMRAHSTSFLDTGSRRLGFGSVQIITNAG